MAATERQWSIREDGCLIINKNLQGVTYHSSLNAIILSSKDQTITVLDATSGIVLQKSDLSGKKCETLRCIYLPEKDRCIFSDTHSVSVRRDLRGILLLDTALQIPVKRSDEIIRLEIPLAEAVQLFDALVNVELAGIEHVEDVVKELDRSIELARKATEGSHKTAKWATVCIQLQHGALKSVCSALVAEIKRTSQQGQGLPVAAAISDRLSHLLPISNDNGAGPVDRSLMYSEAARRHTFSKWPHMGYKWALPEPMAQAGFYHQPNSPGDDRAMCFTCNVCLVCWEPTDEPWSEHERHSPQCPYIKGDFTQNVPLAVTYATQPAQMHGEGQKIACISSTCNEDFIATSTRDGSIVVWNISHMLQKECAFNLDLSDATVALKTGLQIERVGWTADLDTRGQGSKVESEVTAAQEKCLEFTEKEEECIQEINLHKNADDNIEGKNRPSDDLIVSSLCIIDWSSCKNSEHLASLACPQVKGACAAETVEPSLVCGASLLRTKAMYRNDSECWPSSQLGSSLDGHQEVVQLMNQVNQGIWNGDLHIIPEPASGSVGEDFVWPESVFVPHLLVVSFRAESSNGVHVHAKSKEPGSEGNSGSGGIVGDTGSSSKPTSTVGEGSKVVPVSTLVPVKESPWSILLENDPWLDPDVQIVGFTPGHSQPSQLKDGPLSGISKPVPILQNGPSDLSGPFHTFSAFGSEGSSPLSPGMHMHPDILSEVWHKESESEEKSGDALRCPGSVLQCVPLPEEFCNEMLEIKTLQPTVDRHYVIVVVAPKSEYICCNESPCVDLGCSSEDSGQVQGTGTDTASLFHRQDSSKASAPINISGGSQAASEVSASSQRNTTRNLVLGGVMVYKVKTVNGYTVLEDNPCMVHKIWQPEKVVREIFVLPPEVAEQIDEEETIAQLGMASGLTGHHDFQGGSTNGLGAIGQVAMITQEGALKILNLADARIIADLSPDDGEKFISAAYCTGIEHLCVCTTSGKLKFYQVSQQQTTKSGEMHMQENKTPRVLPSAMDGVDGKKVAVEEDVFDASPGKPSQGSCCLADGPLVPENLLALHSLTQFENLMPRFTATVPPCWSEIQQEQQQRRHPQHLQQQGEATQHTRSWKLTQNGTTWDEHLFEIVLPRPCCIGHVDVKFTLHPMCTTAPNIEVTLLKQNIGNVGRQIHLSSHPKSRDRHPRSSGSSSTEKDNVNYVLDPAFLEKNNAEILCGPIKLSSCLDLSGGGGLASLSSPSLLNCKPRSLLLHIKGFKNETSDNSDASDKASSSSSEEKADKAPEVKKKGISYMEYKGIKCLFENVPNSGSGASAVERLSASAPKQKLTDVKGCDWLAEISLTVRKFKRTSVLRERQQRNAMLESPSFHEKLLRAVTCPPAELQGMNAEHYQNLALDILLWIGSLQMNDPLRQSGSKCLVVTLEPFLRDLVKACFVNATRTTSHKCARLLAQSIEFAKLSEDQDLAPSFSVYLLQALVSCLSLLVFCSSAGAMRWFFAILNHVKCMDTSLVARSVMDLLNSVAAQYQQNMSPLHALLKTRYGLYGHPFDVEMFDVELPHNLRQGPIPPSSYAAAAAKGACAFHGPSAATSGAPAMSSASASGSGGQNKEEPDLYEMLSMPHEKTGRSQAEYMRHHVLGLLEVEPLPFTCHATSDGTRVERMDAASAATTATATGPNITAPSVPLSMGPVNLDEPPPSGGLLVGGPFVSGAVGTSTGSMSSLAVADSLKKALQTYAAINAKQMHPSKLHQLLSWSGGAPKTTPNFLTPSVTPPSEAWQPPVLPSFLKDVDKHLSSPPPPPPPPPPLPQQPEKSLQTPTGGEGQPDILKLQATFSGLSQTPHQQQQQAAQKPSPYPQTHTLLQSPPDQVLVIERMHSGARRFVTLDFGKVVVLTDVVIPACGDLASLSIDVWVQGEEVDGQRLVVASDIGTRTLVMNNIMPAPICRYLKITTVGRYGAGTTRSRIPLGAFYGHSYILPWEWREYVDSHSFSPVASINSAPSPLSSPPHSSRGSGVASPVKQLEAASQSSLVQHLGVFLSLQEDLHCLYSLACSRLSGLLSSVSDTQFVSSHVKYYLKRGQQPLEEDTAILKSYNECLQLQLQLNLAQRAITRLQRALGVKVGGYDETTSVTTQLQQTSTDKLRVMLEGLLDTLLGLTVPCPAVPQPPAALYMALPPSTAEALFRNICLLGSRHTQVKTGLLLSRVCGSQPWWGTFLGNILQEFFHSEYSQVFPQDRVFVLVSALGQKALAGPSAVHIMDSLLAMLTSVLQPLVASRETSSRAGSLDLGLVSWILLFLCRNFEAALSPAITDESEKGGKREKEGTGGRWSFIQGSWKSLCPSSGKSKSRRLYSRSMQKRILHHKQKLEDIEAAKALMDVAKDKVTQTKASSKESKVFLKEQEALIKKELAQFRSKHFKDMIYMRRNDLEILRRLPKEDGANGGVPKELEDSSDSLLVLPRDRCLMVVRGLMALLLSMDFSCHVDLFLVACKVLARICVVTRPALRLGEVMSQDQLEWLVLLAVHHDATYGPTLWGGPWASHAITCLLQDLLEGEKLYPRHLASSEEDLLRSEAGDDDEQLTPSATSLNLDEVTDDDMDNLTDGAVESGIDPSLDKDTTLMMDLLMEEAELEGDSLDALFMVEPPQTSSKMFPGLHPAFSPFSPKSFSFSKKSKPFPVSQQNGQMEFGDGQMESSMTAPMSDDAGISLEKKTGRLRLLKTRLNNLISTKSGTNSHGLSVAQDARLEFGLQWLPELRLRVMLSVHMESILGAFTFPIPPPPQLPHILGEPPSAAGFASTDDELSQATLPGYNILTSAAMLSQCFDHLFAQLLHGRVSLDTVLQLWLTLNQNSSSPVSQDDHTSMTFNSTCIPSVPLGPQAVRHLMEAVVAAPVVSVRSWVFVLHTMCLLINQRADAVSVLEEGAAGGMVGQDLPLLDGGLNSTMASVVLTDPNLVPLIIKFLSGTSVGASASSGLQFYQAGPTATKAFDDFLRRLLCKSVNLSGQNLKELLLKIVFQLTTERGAVAACTGPLDAQCKFVETVASLAFDAVDLSNAISVVAAISALVHQHILCQDPVLCSSSHDSSISARSCFSGLFASLLRGGESRGAGGEPNRDQLMCSLLRLINKLVQVVLPGSQPRGASGTLSSGGMENVGLAEAMSDAAKLNRAFSSSMSSSAVPLASSTMSDDEKRQQTSSSSGGVRDGGVGPDAGSSERRQMTERYVADLILANHLVMQNLVQALSYCSSNKMALILGSAPAASSSGMGATSDSFNMGDPLSVGDGIYQILCTLLGRATNSHSMINSLFHYLSANYTQMNPSSLCRLSEPLLKFLLRVLDSAAAVRHFVHLGGIQVLCNSLVRSSQQFVSVGPGIISTIMQNMSSLGATLADEKAKAADSENVEGLFNFAPLGSIVATSPTASPPDALIQTSAPHRRARTAAWSYHFYPDEPWVELVVTLPFAVLLRQVDIRPHSGALTTCPSFVSLEISHDGWTVVPTSPPLVTCSLAIIKLQLLRPEVVSSVTLRLHRPRDSMTIGLQQVCLRGQRAFGEVGEGPSALLPSEDTMSTCSMAWLRLLYHCLMSHPEVAAEVARAATPTCNLLNTCTSLLISPTAALYAAKIESVLLQLGLSSMEIGLALIDNILRNQAQCTGRGGGHIYLGRVSGVSSPYTMEILYQLGITQDLGTKNRVQALLQWLADSAQAFICRQMKDERMADSNSPIPSPAPEHVHCVAAVLWYSHDLPVEYDLQELVTENFVQFLYTWSSMLPVDSVLKKSINNVLCASCYIHPPYFRLLLRLTGFVIPEGVSTAVTDDSKDSATRQHQQQGIGGGSMTDDSKEARLQPQNLQPSHCGLDAGTMTDDSKEATLLSHSQQSLRNPVLDCGHLATIAVVSRSPAAVSQLLHSGLPAVLTQGLAEFCSHQIALIAEQNLASDARRQRQETTDNGPRKVDRSSSEQGCGSLTADLVAAILSFFAELCWEPSIKDWLGTSEGNVFWPALLTLLCNTSAQRPPVACIATSDRQKVMNVEERALVETTAIQFFTGVIACHSVNQLFFAKVLCDVIRQQGASRSGTLLGTVPLSGFTRRMLLQVLLEDEKILVALRMSSELYCHLNTTSPGNKGSSWRMHHPSFGAGRGCCSLIANINNPCSDVMGQFGDPTTAAMVASSLLEGRDDSKQAEVLAKETTELGIEVMEYINAAGVLAKVKREKSPSPSKTGLPPRPPTRRGHVYEANSSSLKFPHCTLHLQHSLMKGKALPGDLTFSQLTQILLQRGLAPGTTTLSFDITVNTRTIVPPSSLQAALAAAEMGAFGSLLEWGDKAEDIPDEFLLASPAFPSALQVFASVGGLALLAEHLPLLYPHIARQGMAADVGGTENNNLPDLGQEWVTVESSDELFDPYMEPVSPAPASSQAARHVAGAMPTIPPHSLIAFGLFLRLPGYAEVLLKERKKAQCLLRLVLGVTDDGDGGHILTSPIASSLPTLPFTVLKSLLDASPLTTDDGVLLRRMVLDIGVLHLVLACLSVLSHHMPRIPVSGFQQETQVILAAMQAAATQNGLSQSEEKTQHYWAKGTGFGTGSTTSSWDAEQALLRQRSEEEHVAGLLQVLGSYINPGGVIPKDFCDQETPADKITVSASNSDYAAPSREWPLPEVLFELLSHSCLVPAISSYLRNDSVLDMARHVPLYRALLHLLRGMAVCPSLVPLLLPMPLPQSQFPAEDGCVPLDSTPVSIEKLLAKMKGCVDTYASRLKSNKGKGILCSKGEEEESEGLALLIPDIQETARIVSLATQRLKEAGEQKEGSSHGIKQTGPSAATTEERYLSIMGPMQFDTYELVTEEGRGLKFNIPHHFESNVKASGAFNNPARTRRLAQEAVTLSTSLPLSYNSSVFVRCDEERLDIMKVLITGPSDTPYANGAFEFDVYFPQDYPNSPPYINLETTGNHTVRFNPNLYNDGKVCLSILNTWHGRPEEKWNAQTSSFLQVLVSIQSLILVSEPYFNEPGYERSRGTQSGTASSHEYDANIRQATVKWAMLEQIRNPSGCFKEVIHYHFWLKRHEILRQCEDWIAEMEQHSSDKRTGRSIAHSTLALKRHYNQLREELSKLKPPPELEADCDGIDPNGKHYSTDAPQVSAASSIPLAVPKPTSAPTTSNLAVNSTGLGPYIGPNGLFVSDPFEQEVPDV